MRTIRLTINEEKIVEKPAIDLLTSTRILPITSSVPWLSPKSKTNIACLLSFDKYEEEFYITLIDKERNQFYQLQSLSNILNSIPEVFLKHNCSPNTDCLNNLIMAYHLGVKIYTKNKFEISMSLHSKNSPPLESFSFACPEDLISNLFTENLNKATIQDILKELVQWKENKFISYLISFLERGELDKVRKFMFINMSKISFIPIEAKCCLRDNLMGESQIPTLR